MTEDEQEGIFGSAFDDRGVEEEADHTNLEATLSVSPIPTTRIHKDHPINQIIGDLYTPHQTRSKVNKQSESALVSHVKKLRRTNHKDYQNLLVCLFLITGRT